MANRKWRYVKPERDRHGRVRYWYFRRNGRRWRLPDRPGSPAFVAEYARLLAATEPAKPTGAHEHPPGSIGAVILEYFEEPEFTDRKLNTQRIYRLILEQLAERIGHHHVAYIERRHVKKLRNERAETPGMANMAVKVLRVLLAYAVDNGYRRDNPAVRVKMFKLGEHRAWTADECARFEARWAPGTMQRRAYMLARHTGQRCGDLAKMTRAHRNDGFIYVIQEKTNKELWVYEHGDLTKELSLGEHGHMSLLVAPNGAAFTSKRLGQYFADAIDEAELPDACVLHGLRKNAAAAFAEAGCSPHLIGAITGHEPDSPEIVRYTKAASRRGMAQAAIHMLENAAGTQTGKRSRGGSGKRRGAR
jgi:site-specific recombinase XerD